MTLKRGTGNHYVRCARDDFSPTTSVSVLWSSRTDHPVAGLQSKEKISTDAESWGGVGMKDACVCVT